MHVSTPTRTDDGLLVAAAAVVAAQLGLRAVVADAQTLASIATPIHTLGAAIAVVAVARGVARTEGRDRLAWSVIVGGGLVASVLAEVVRVTSRTGNIALIVPIAVCATVAVIIVRTSVWSNVTILRSVADSAWMVAASAPAWWAVCVEPVWNRRVELGAPATAGLFLLSAVGVVLAADLLTSIARCVGPARISFLSVAAAAVMCVVVAQVVGRIDPAEIESWYGPVKPLLAIMQLIAVVTGRHPRFSEGLVEVRDTGERWFWAITLVPLGVALPVTMAVGEVSPLWPAVAMPLLAWRAGLVVRENAQLLAAEGRRVMSDPLTGLANRRALPEIGRQPEAGTTGVCFVDLDGFKPVNDDLGHEAGDAVLVAVARRLERCVRAQDVVVRMGGDEFAVVLTDPVDEAGVDEVARRILAAMNDPIAVAGGEVTLSASIGTAIADSSTVPALMSRADEAMYVAKRAGGGQVVLAA